MLFTAGAMGAGKSWTIRKISERGYFKRSVFVSVDPDELRSHLPEYRGYLEHDANTAGEKTHREASLMSEIAVSEALRESKHVLVDSSLRDWAWYKLFFAEVRRKYPKRKIALIYVEADHQLVYDRARTRAQESGRVVPRDLIDAAISEVPVSVEKLKALTDYTATIVNNPDGLLLKSGDSCWADFKARWGMCEEMTTDPEESRTNLISWSKCVPLEAGCPPSQQQNSNNTFCPKPTCKDRCHIQHTDCLRY